MAEPSTKAKSFICPFADGKFVCPEQLCPTRPAPSSQEKKLFVLMGREPSTTKKTCTRCTVFWTVWKKHVGIWGHIKYALKWLGSKKIRSPQPQENL